MGDGHNGFGQREKSFEAKFLHDEDLLFRIQAKRNRLFGLWAAELLGHKGDKVYLYVEEVIIVDVQKCHEDDVVHKVLRDFAASQISISEHRVRKKLQECWEEARKLVMEDKGR